MVIVFIEPASRQKARASEQLVAKIVEMVTEKVSVEIGRLVLSHNYHVLSSYAHSSYYVCPIPLYEPVLFKLNLFIYYYDNMSNYYVNMKRIYIMFLGTS